MKLKKLFFEILLLLLFFTVIIFLLEFKYRNYQAHCDNLFKGINTNLDSITIIYIGNSHTFVLKEYNADSTQHIRNLSYPGFDLFAEYAMLHKYIPQMKNVKKIYLGLDYEALGYNMAFFGQDYINRQLYKYTDTLYRNSFFNRLITQSNFFRANRDITFLFSNTQKVVNDKETAATQLSHNITGNTNECKDRAIEITSVKFNADLIKENISLLQNIINLSKKFNKELIVFNAPKTACFRSFANETNMMRSKSKLDSVLKVDDIIYHDFYDDPDFMESDFANMDHLNRNGSKKLIDKLSAK